VPIGSQPLRDASGLLWIGGSTWGEFRPEARGRFVFLHAYVRLRILPVSRFC
jgi:hypothetical protein